MTSERRRATRRRTRSRAPIERRQPDAPPPGSGRWSGTVVEALSRIPYFRRLPEVELARLAARCEVRALAAGASLFEEGEPCRGLFIVIDGAVEVRQISLRGREQVFHTEGPGATLGEAPLFDGGGFIATAVAVRPARALLLPRAELLALCRRRPDVALAMLETLARRLRGFASIVADLAFRPVMERLARHLDGAAGARPMAAGTVLDLSMTHAQLAARLGTVRELVARAFAQLESAGCITRRRRGVVIRDPVRLAAIGRGEP